MQFSPPLIAGTLLKRYKRFLADVVLASGEEVTAHCANPGAMLGLCAPGSQVYLSKSNNPKRKLAYSWELVRADDTWVGINTMHPNRLVQEAISDARIAQLEGYPSLRREVKYGVGSRIDFLLQGAGRRACYVEVKNVHLLRQEGLAEFPDCVTERGTKHLMELAHMVDQGHRAVMLYLIQRADAKAFSLAGDIDPVYRDTFLLARARGVEALAYGCSLSPEYIVVADEVPLV